MNWCALEESLREIICQGSIQSVFQPIVDIRKQLVLGYEALSRGPSDSPLYSAGVLFETAERAGLQQELERLCRNRAAQRFKALSVDGYLFVNISPQVLEPPVFDLDKLDRLMSELDVEATKVVLELSERYPATDMGQTLKALAMLKERGFKVAIDDLGAGYSGLKLWSEVKPDYVKIDRHFIRDIDTDLVKREFVASVVNLANGMGCQLVAEGVETESEYKTIHELGIPFCQGFYFGKPKVHPVATNLNRSRPSMENKISLGKVGALATYIPPVSPLTPLGDVAKRFSDAVHVSSIPVVDDEKPVGMISKWSLMELFSLPFGRALHEKKAVKHYMTQTPIVVPWGEDLSIVSRMLTDEEDLYIRQHFIITKESKYHGIGSTRDVLKRITDMKIRSARYANPLTLLPGNVPINEKLREMEESRERYSLAYFDIDNFKPLNDVLGYSIGDQVIQLLANILRAHLHDQNSFIGHVGGDDFLVVFHGVNDLTETCHKIQQSFSQKVKSFYPSAMANAGYMDAFDRNGEPQKFPLSTLSVGVVQQDIPEGESSLDISTLAARAKKRAKLLQAKFCVMKVSDNAKDAHLSRDGLMRGLERAL
ncbi:GGDEF domain-containing protein [Litoribrevibacter euphylliae]|uniref:GGDEF domain-containing protein n=1 Tax=Litoribrevibacter euphylliae TaxID=1834034 RepID=A0ABV7HF70_9GAMM